ncbi:G-patch domain [Sesbania bispinosa]|nr:G-patch domain [Sesbania bispinosa]
MYPHHQAHAPQGVQWPIYGLPPGYTPPVLTNPPDNHTPATNPDPQSQMPQGVQWPTYGLPPGYTPLQLTNPQDNNTTEANTDPQNQAQQIDPGHILVWDVADIKTPMELISEELCEVGAIEKKGDSRKGAMCDIHPDAEHSIEKCEKFKEVLQSLIDSQLVQISCERDERGVNVVQELENAQTQAFSKKYDVQVGVGDVQGNRVDPSIGHGAPVVTNISGIGGMTRSGRIYTPKELQETFEIANASYAKEGAPIVGPHLSRASMMIAKNMLEKGYQLGQGLGKTMKGIADVLRLGENKDKFGLGYKATPADRKMVAEEKKEKRLA